jgi:S-methylmethionine-dependent homocysteine/selenocysteine methylase
VLLDGSLPTELRLAGDSAEAPWWTNRLLMTGRGRALIRSVHQTHLAAGADVLTAATYPCDLGTLLGLGLDPSAGTAWMVHAAVGVARAAVAGRRGVLVAGVVGAPRGMSSDEESIARYRWLVAELARCRVDVVLAESMPSIGDAVVVVDHAVAMGCVPWVSLPCAGRTRLPSGESIAEAALTVWQHGAQLVAVNCGTPDEVETALRAVREWYPGPLGAYPDVAGPAVGDLARTCTRWRAEFGLDLVGGCCGATTGLVRALSGVTVTEPARGS